MEAFSNNTSNDIDLNWLIILAGGNLNDSDEFDHLKQLLSEAVCNSIKLFKPDLGT